MERACKYLNSSTSTPVRARLLCTYEYTYTLSYLAIITVLCADLQKYPFAYVRRAAGHYTLHCSARLTQGGVGGQHVLIPPFSAQSPSHPAPSPHRTRTRGGQ